MLELDWSPLQVFYSLWLFSTASFVWGLYVHFRQYRLHRDTEKRPDSVAEIISVEDYEKARLYSLAKHRFGFVKDLVGQVEQTLILFAFVTVYVWNRSGEITERYYGQSEIIQSIVFSVIHNVLGMITGIPFKYYETFVIEEEFGFNKQTPAFFFKDQIKKFVLSTVITSPIIAVVIWIIQAGGPYFFVYAWIFISFVIFVMMTIYPEFIAPLFDKYTPLPESPLKEKIEALASRLEFPLTKLYVVEGSKRSAHSNAYMYGFHKNKRIVLFDTLLDEEMNKRLKALHDDNKDETKEAEEKPSEEEKPTEEDPKKNKKPKGMSDDEVVAVLGHELGHWKLNHTIMMLVIAELNLFFVLVVFSYFYKSTVIYEAFGFKSQPVLIGLTLVLQYVLGPFNELMGLAMSCLSRYNEFNADKFSADLGYADLLSKALIKLSGQNLSMPIDDHIYSMVNHSHPPVVEQMLRSKLLTLRPSAVRVVWSSTVGGSNAPITINGKPASELYDEKSDRLQTIDIDELPRAQKRFAVQFEKINAERIKDIFAKNYKNHISMAVLLTLVISIYYYTVYAVKQETFLEEIDEEVAQEKGEIRR
ncbi:CAAX prenyl protease 1-like protein [Aphelenchoides besseyi]|nr:CAAX prenyl protease 1-like protein [Aphelenchoides besseyi]KAI6208232.1 CAAX prenyl protease 1-like protein [Aphelenchoides besseyi]